MPDIIINQNIPQVEVVISASPTITVNSVSGNTLAVEKEDDVRITASGISSFDGSNYVSKNETGLFYPTSNPSGFVDEQYVLGVSGYLEGQIASGSSAFGVSSVNGLAGNITINSPLDYLSILNSGNQINIEPKPQNTMIFRNELGEITGIRKNIDTVAIYRNDLSQITGIFYSSYYKKILFDGSNNITGTQIFPL